MKLKPKAEKQSFCITVRFTPSEAKVLKRLPAKNNNVSIASFIRDAVIAMYL